MAQTFNICLLALPILTSTPGEMAQIFNIYLLFSVYKKKFYCRLQNARNILCDEESRKKYDFWRKSGIAVPYDQWIELSGAAHSSLHWAAKPRKELMLDYGKGELQLKGLLWHGQQITFSWGFESILAEKVFNPYVKNSVPTFCSTTNKLSNLGKLQECLRIFL